MCVEIPVRVGPVKAVISPRPPDCEILGKSQQIWWRYQKHGIHSHNLLPTIGVPLVLKCCLPVLAHQHTPLEDCGWDSGQESQAGGERPILGGTEGGQSQRGRRGAPRDGTETSRRLGGQTPWIPRGPVLGTQLSAAARTTLPPDHQRAPPGGGSEGPVRPQDRQDACCSPKKGPRAKELGRGTRVLRDPGGAQNPGVGKGRDTRTTTLENERL